MSDWIIRNINWLQITDFGFSKLIDDNTVLKTYCGTPIYLAPEVIEARTQNTNYTNACDIWSMAVILFVLLAGYHPFNHPSSRSALEKNILEGIIDTECFSNKSAFSCKSVVLNAYLIFTV